MRWLVSFKGSSNGKGIEKYKLDIIWGFFNYIVCFAKEGR